MKRRGFAGGGAPVKLTQPPGMQWGNGTGEGPMSHPPTGGKDEIKPSDRSPDASKSTPAAGEWTKGKTNIAGLFYRHMNGSTNDQEKGLIRFGPTTTAIFDVTKPKEMLALNKLEREAHFDEVYSPAKHITLRKDHVVGQRLIVYLCWADVHYRQLKP
jgi:hypothetical protein